MFGRHPRLTIDAFLGLHDRDKKPKNHQNYEEQLKERMAMAYKEAGKQAAKKSEKDENYATLFLSQVIGSW